MNYKISFLLLFTVVLSNFALSSQSTITKQLENTEISILTCRSGDALDSTFGHSGIRIKNTMTNIDVVFNYGLFSFDTPFFYLKFMRGKLPYFVGASQSSRFIGSYFDEKRSVLEQKLNLELHQKKQIIEFLIWNSKRENRAYPYDFFYDNCATRIGDILGNNLNLEYTNEPQNFTFRQLLKQNLQNLPWSDFGIDLVIGARADRTTDRNSQMFLPEYVHQHLNAAIIAESGLPLVTSDEVIIDFEEMNVARKKGGLNYPLILSILLFVMVFMINFLAWQISRPINKVLLWISSALGLFILFMWFGTDHGATKNNWNLLWLNPLLLIYLWSNGMIKKAIFYVLAGMFLASILNTMAQFLPQYFHSAFLPLAAMFLVSLYFDFRYRSTIDSA